MAKRHASALRQHRRSVKSAERNQRNVARLRTALKGIRGLIAEKKTDELKRQLPETISLIDHSIGAKTLHRNAAARLKSRLTRQTTALSAK
jgi:small subunit ribosomal protein S20